MSDNLNTYKSIFGEAFNIKQADGVEARNFAVRSFVTGNVVNCTLWDSSHSHIDLVNGDVVVVNGKIKTTPKKDGDGVWVNLSVGKIALIPMDAGTRDDAPAKTAAASDDEPDVL